MRWIPYLASVSDDHYLLQKRKARVSWRHQIPQWFTQVENMAKYCNELVISIFKKVLHTFCSFLHLHECRCLYFWKVSVNISGRIVLSSLFACSLNRNELIESFRNLEMHSFLCPLHQTGCVCITDVYICSWHFSRISGHTTVSRSLLGAVGWQGIAV